MASKLRQETKTYVVCPKCDSNVGTVDHLREYTYDKFWGPWYCDNCGQGVSGAIKNGEVIVGECSKSKGKAISILYRDGLVFFLETDTYSDWEEEENKDRRFYYEEYTCPTNFLGEVFSIYDSEDEDLDTHGIFKYIYTHPIPWEDFEKVRGMSYIDLSEYLNIDIKRIKEVVDNKKPIYRSSINGVYFGEPIWKDWVEELRIKK